MFMKLCRSAGNDILLFINGPHFHNVCYSFYLRLKSCNARNWFNWNLNFFFQFGLNTYLNLILLLCQVYLQFLICMHYHLILPHFGVIFTACSYHQYTGSPVSLPVRVVGINEDVWVWKLWAWILAGSF